MRLFDSHTHINEENFSEEERAERIAEIEKDENIAYVMDVGCDMLTSQLACRHSAEHLWCFGAVGFHPHFAEDMGDGELALIKGMAGKEKIRAIGEIGLDYHYDNADRNAQRECFRKQIRLANELMMPIIIHSRDADQETMDILKEEGAFSEERKKHFGERPVPAGWESAAGDARVLLHCFSGSKELAEQYVRLGGWISVAGPVTYKNNRKTTAVVEQIPLEFLMVETDAPYLAPEPKRGRPNRTPYVIHTARRVGVIKGVSLEEVAEATCRNAMRFFGVK